MVNTLFANVHGVPILYRCIHRRIRASTILRDYCSLCLPVLIPARDGVSSLIEGPGAQRRPTMLAACWVYAM